MEPKVSVLQANTQCAQIGEYWTWNQRLIRGLGSILTGGNIFVTGIFCFHVVKPSDANIDIIANYV